MAKLRKKWRTLSVEAREPFLSLHAVLQEVQSKNETMKRGKSVAKAKAIKSAATSKKGTPKSKKAAPQKAKTTPKTRPAKKRRR